MSEKKYTLITGASCGLGKEMAEECAKRGMHLLLTALPPLARDCHVVMPSAYLAPLLSQKKKTSARPTLFCFSSANPRCRAIAPKIRMSLVQVLDQVIAMIEKVSITISGYLIIMGRFCSDCTK